MVKKQIIKKLNIIFLILLLSNCSQENRFRNIENYHNVEQGDNLIEVTRKMKSQPDRVIYGDTIYLYQEKVTDIITFIYFTPRSASSNISIYFKDCKVLDKHFD